MDLILYVIVVGAIGVINTCKNGGMTMLEHTTLSTAIEDNEISKIVQGMEVGSNLYCNYNSEAFCKIVKDLGLM